MAQIKPTKGLIYFMDFLSKQKMNFNLKVVDIGCGKGRNAIYLARSGMEVYAMDYIQSALECTKQMSIRHKVANRIHLFKTGIDKPWPFINNFFDIALDSFSSIDIETKKGREIYKQELYRTLKPGGFAFVMVVSSEDEWEKKLIKSNPGKEKNSTIWPQNGKFQKDYEKTELEEFYKDFELISIKEIKAKAFKLGKKYMATDFWAILKKPISDSQLSLR